MEFDMTNFDELFISMYDFNLKQEHYNNDLDISNFIWVTFTFAAQKLGFKKGRSLAPLYILFDESNTNVVCVCSLLTTQMVLTKVAVQHHQSLR